MSFCTNITLEKIRAIITFGTLTFETPDIKSFTVTRSRSQLAATFSASIEVPSTTIFPAGEDIVIEAGVQGDLKRIFTGRVLTVTVNPSFENASAYVVNLAGSDRFQELEGKNISRRQRARALSSFAAITGISSRAPQKGLSVEKREQSGGSHQLVNYDTNIREHSKLVRTDRIAWDPFNPARDPEGVEDRQGVGDGTGVGSTIDIKPKSVALSPGISVLYTVQNVTYETGDTWTVSDPDIGTIVNRNDGTAVYTQRALGENTVTFSKGGSTAAADTGRATAVGIPIHDHSSLGQGGPAFGVYGSE